MNQAEFKRLYQGDFRPNNRETALHQRLEKYYRDIPDSMPNKVAKGYWFEFKQWCRDRGYTQEEINQAKRAVRV